jgi:tRNA (uracil-5-)-methyltransferase TRM9
MQRETAVRLIELNRQFYQTFGKDFSATRGRIQPGVRQLLTSLKGSERILDLGCGNGELARELARQGHRGAYLGVDFSLPLLQDAASQPEGFSATFVQADLSGDWDAALENNSSPEKDKFDVIFCFATLHHIPSIELRLKILQQIYSKISRQGKFFLSNWQFLNSEKLTKRIQPWQRAGFSSQEVDEGDYLLDWRAGGTGLRYAHQYSEAELASLAAQTNFRVVRTYLSDGENGRLGLYQIWEAA